MEVLEVVEVEKLEQLREVVLEAAVEGAKTEAVIVSMG